MDMVELVAQHGVLHAAEECFTTRMKNEQ